MSETPSDLSTEATFEVTAFERSTTYRLCVEAARHWLLTHYLARHELPEGTKKFWVYPNGPEACLDWGNAPGPLNDGSPHPLRGKRIAVTFTVEEG